VANFHGFQKNMDRELIKAMSRNAQRTHERAVRYAPYSKPGDYPGAGTFRLRRSIHWWLSERGRVFHVECDPALFREEGFPYYAWWVHEGTSRMAARPFMRRAYEELKSSYTLEVTRAMVRALR